MGDWQSQRRERDERLQAASKFAQGKTVPSDAVTSLLEVLNRPGDHVCLEGDNQKQADFLAACLAKAQQQATAWIGQQVGAQASFLAYIDAFWVLMLVALAMLPLALSLRKVTLGSAAPAH
jgi:hypothetical protein